MKTYKSCQSCGYPMKKDKKGGGSEADGSISKKYCSMCYESGKFLSPPDVDTAQKFQQFCIQEMKKDGMSGLLAWFLTRGIPKLERWRDK
jgi:Putative zinc ribbon domain